MRIVAGRWRGRRLAAPDNAATRPTADRVRQALFDMLTHAPWGQPWPPRLALDAFAGTGALGLEALSRGAERVIFFESERTALACLRDNIATLGAGPAARILAMDVTRPPAPPSGGCDLLFLDPPYRQGLVGSAMSRLCERGWVASSAMVVAETAPDERPELPGDVLEQRRLGAALLTFCRTP